MYMRSFDNLFLESKWIASIWRVYNWGKNFQHLKVLYKNSASKIQLEEVMFNFFRERLSKYESVEEPGCPDRNPTPPQMWEERQKIPTTIESYFGWQQQQKPWLDSSLNKQLIRPRIQEVRFQIVSNEKTFVCLSKNQQRFACWLKQRGNQSQWTGCCDYLERPYFT